MFGFVKETTSYGTEKKNVFTLWYKTEDRGVESRGGGFFYFT
jgi:hypothetical protein